MRRIFRVVALALAALLLATGAWVAFCMWHHPRDPDAERAVPLAIARAAPTPGRATVLFAGDTALTDAALPTLTTRGFEYPFSLTVDLVRDADLAVVNAEAPITDGGDRIRRWKDFVYRSPARAAEALSWAGVDVLSLANNHAMDYGASGLADTIANATAHGMITVGAGATPADARRGVIATLGDVRVGLLAYCEEKIAWRVWTDQFVRAGHPGVAALTDDDLARDVARMRPQVDVLVVGLHLGDNYAPPTAAARAWSRRAIELGADLVVGHHPHLAHPIETWRGRPILLSLGNYAFGTPGHPELDWGWLALAQIEGRKLARVEMVPIAVQNARVEFRPEPLKDAELARALERLRTDSAAYGTDVHIEAGRGIVYGSR